MSRLDTLGAVILAYGTSNKHAQLADEVVAQGVPRERLVIVHNPDRLPNTADVHAPAGARVVRMSRNAGYAAAMNRGIAEVRRTPGVEAVMLLTHDVELHPGALSALADAAARHPGFGVLAPVLRQPTMRSEPSYGSRQWGDGSVGHITDRPPGEAVAEVAWVDGSAMLVRLAALDVDAPLPEGYFHVLRGGVPVLDARPARLADRKRARRHGRERTRRLLAAGCLRVSVRAQRAAVGAIEEEAVRLLDEKDGSK